MAIAVLQRLAAYRANPDPRAAAANTLALLLACDGPIYPFYLYLIVGRACWPSLFALWAVPFYAAVPALARRHSLAARVMLMVVSTANTVVYTRLFGAQSGLELFMLPCIGLGLLFHKRERMLSLALAGIPLVLFVWLRQSHFTPLRAYTDAAYRSISALSEISVATLSWFLVVLYGAMTHTHYDPDAPPGTAGEQAT